MKINIKTTTSAASLAMLLSGCELMAPSSTINNTGLPQSLSIVKKSTQVSSAQCVAGGIQIIQGLDFNHDGLLGPYERQSEDIVCYPTSNGKGTIATRPTKKNKTAMPGSNES